MAVAMKFEYPSYKTSVCFSKFEQMVYMNKESWYMM